MKDLIYPGKKYVDKSGDRIWFPSDGKPFFDMAFRKTFNNVEERASFINSRGLVNTGDSDEKRKKELRIQEELKHETMKQKNKERSKQWF